MPAFFVRHVTAHVRRGTCRKCDTYTGAVVVVALQWSQFGAKT